MPDYSLEKNEQLKIDILEKLKKIGHFLSLKNIKEADIISSEIEKLSPELDKLEGNERKKSLSWIGESLSQINTNSSSTLSESDKNILNTITQAFIDTENFSDQKFGEINSVRDIIVEGKYIEKIKNNKVVILPSGWKVHAIGMVFINNRLIITNTGAGSQGFPGSFIYKVEPQKLTTESLANLMNKKTQQELDAAIEAITVRDELPIYNRHAYQKVGNCSVSNPKKSIESIIACLRALENQNGKELTTEAIQSELKLMGETPDSNLFKFITAKMRENALEDFKKLENEFKNGGNKEIIKLIDDTKGLIVEKNNSKLSFEERLAALGPVLNEKKMGDKITLSPFLGDFSKKESLQDYENGKPRLLTEFARITKKQTHIDERYNNKNTTNDLPTLTDNTIIASLSEAKLSEYDKILEKDESIKNRYK